MKKDSAQNEKSATKATPKAARKSSRPSGPDRNLSAAPPKPPKPRKVQKKTSGGTNNLFLAVMGLTTATITEGLYGLCRERKIRIDQVRILTTEDGAAFLKRDLPDAFKDIKSDYPDEIGNLEIDLDRDVWIAHGPDGSTLNDVRTAEQNDQLADGVLREVARWCGDPAWNVHASIAGGRKTMSHFLGTAMQLLGRAHDHIYHVLVPEEFEVRGFYFPTRESKPLTGRRGEPLDAKDATVDMAEIPFVRLLGLFDKKTLPRMIENVSLSNLISRADNSLHGPSLEVYVYWHRDRKQHPRIHFHESGKKDPLVVINNQRADVIEFVLYTYLLSKRKEDALIGAAAKPRRIPILRDEKLGELFVDLLRWVRRLAKGDLAFEEGNSELIRDLKEYQEGVKQGKDIKAIHQNFYARNIGSRISNFNRRIVDRFARHAPWVEPSHYTIQGIGFDIPPTDKGLWYVNIHPSQIHFVPEDVVD